MSQATEGKQGASGGSAGGTAKRPRLAVLTGASRGLGAALYSLLEEAGWTLVEFSRSGGRRGSRPVDLSYPLEAREFMLDHLKPLAEQEWDEILFVGNAARLDPMGPVHRKGTEEVLANIQTNFSSAILFLSLGPALFQEHWARKTLVNISSGAALKGYPGWSLYCAAKAGLENWVRATGAEQESEARPFQVLSFDPGVMDTAMQAEIRQATPEDFPQVERFVQRKEEGELQDAQRVARAFLDFYHSDNRSQGILLKAADFF